MPRSFWSQSDLEKLREMYSNRPTSEIARALGRGVLGVCRKASEMGLKKTAEYLAAHCRLQKGHRAGRATQFKKGHLPANTGLRRPGYAPGRMKETQFKKGQRRGMAAKNWVRIGTILADSDGYLRIKVREAAHGKEPTGFGNVRVWPLLQRHIWQQRHGPIPAGHIVVFKDRDRKNCAIENLELISLAENMRRNTIWNLPRELAETVQLNGALKRTLRRRTDGQK